jgi:hypothetical protein
VTEGERWDRLGDVVRARANGTVRVRYDVYFLGTDGMWRLQHSFETERCAMACAENVSRYATATVNEVERCSVTGTTLSEVQIAEIPRKGAA